MRKSSFWVTGVPIGSLFQSLGVPISFCQWGPLTPWSRLLRVAQKSLEAEDPEKAAIPGNWLPFNTSMESAFTI